MPIKINKSLFLFFAAIFFAGIVSAQNAEDSVKATVNNLFTAMKSGDAALLKSVFADSAILQTIAKEKSGNTVIKNENIAEFIEFVAKQPKGAADEQISFGTIKIDGDLASVWTPYKFYYNGKFSHCGVNSFQLVRLNKEWKIQFLIDTRRRINCE
ncbi:MAG: nuclear transport factor 2 family protein [Ferruginibacter sp.]